MAREIALGKVHDFVEQLYGADLHAKRVLSLANATTGVLRSGAAGIHAIGRGLALARGQRFAKHPVKQVDRLLSNDGFDVPELLKRWIPYVVADRSEAWVALDWTDFDADKQSTLVASMVSSHGRTTPLAWVTVVKPEIVGHRLEIEEKLLALLKSAMPTTAARIVIIADRGFGDAARWAAITELGFDYVIRIKADFLVTSEAGIQLPAGDWVTPSGNARTLKNATITMQNVQVPTFVAVKKPAMKAAWLLASSLNDVSGPQLINMYGRRFTIEESFRDLKDLRFGMGMSSMRISRPDRRDRLLMLSAIAIALLTVLGAAGEAIGLDRLFKVNTSKKRQYSLFRQGCDYYEFLPGMTDDWATRLVTRFSELIAEHEALTKTLSVI